MTPGPLTLPDGTQATSRRVEIGGLALHVLEAGPADGPPVVLLHGFPEFWFGWRHQIGPLARAGYRVIAPDGRGYNLSDKPKGLDAYRLVCLTRDVVALADALGVGRFGLVGHDWGGIVAWSVAARHPDRVERLAILNAPHPDTTWRVIRQDPIQLLRSYYVALFQLPGLPERMLAADTYAALARALTGSSRPGTFGADDLARYREAWGQPGALTAMLAWYRALVRRPAGRVGRITMPALILWGRRDSALGSTFASESLALCDQGRIRWLDEATHWVQHEEAERVNAALVAFLGGSD